MKYRSCRTRRVVGAAGLLSDNTYTLPCHSITPRRERHRQENCAKVPCQDARFGLGFGPQFTIYMTSDLVFRAGRYIECLIQLRIETHRCSALQTIQSILRPFGRFSGEAGRHLACTNLEPCEPLSPLEPRLSGMYHNLTICARSLSCTDGANNSRFPGIRREEDAAVVILDACTISMTQLDMNYFTMYELSGPCSASEEHQA